MCDATLFPVQIHNLLAIIYRYFMPGQVRNTQDTVKIRSPVGAAILLSSEDSHRNILCGYFRQQLHVRQYSQTVPSGGQPEPPGG